ncbi:MAG: hypothetical protein KUG68_08930 [Flavobacteriaceae bacterium]|nr:hypothetical protein [Flavobacteriaceae bacterium]
MIDFSEIELLKQFKKKFDTCINRIEIDKIDNQLYPLELTINQKKYIVQTDDEYGDLQIDNELLHLVIALKEIETLEASTDYLNWCKQLNLNASNDKLLSYYKEIISHIYDFKNLFEDGIITSFISDLDFQLNAGAIQLLRLNRYI